MLMSGGMNCATLLSKFTKLKERPIMEAMIFCDLEDSEHEVRFAKKMCERFKVPYSLWAIATTPMIDMHILAQPPEKTYIARPRMRHALMMVNAAFRAAQMKYQEVITGHTADSVEDIDTIKIVASEAAVFAGMPTDLFKFPLLEFDSRGRVFEMARDMGSLVEVLYETNSCFFGENEKRFQWGYGCGDCIGCDRRSAGWDNYLDILKKEKNAAI